MTPRPVVNAFDMELEPGPDTPPGYRTRGRQIGPLLEARTLGATIYELDPGESVCPYHYEYGNEEWLLVLEGRPTLRQSDAEHTLEPGDIVGFLDGPEGAHKVTNRSEAVVRILMLSTLNEPSIAVFADSGKVLLKPLRRIFREADAVGYWDGE
jgi:uncharacterized cupin superfamily protein